jgi:adenylyltransferase/sulfurtransferase
MSENRYIRLEKLEWWDTRAVSGARALVAGGGALGNEVIKNLLLLGWGTILVADFDQVERSNLTRSILFSEDDIGKHKAATIAAVSKKINPDCNVIPIEGDIQYTIGAGLAKRMDVIFGCLDNVQARLYLNKVAGYSDRLFIDGGLSPWEGTITLFLSSRGACYACGLTQHDMKELNLRRSCPAYEERARSREGIPTTPTVSSIIGAMMVQDALKWIHGRTEPPGIAIGSQIRIDTSYNRFWKCIMPVNENCHLHPLPVSLIQDHDHKMEDRWDRIYRSWNQRFSGGDISIKLPIPVLEYYECPSCHSREDVNMIYTSQDIPLCKKCQSGMRPNLSDSIFGGEKWLRLTPASMNFPPFTWLKVQMPGGDVKSFELQGGQFKRL